MREQPWDVRKPNLSQTLRWIQLRDFHRLTSKWRTELGLPEVAEPRILDQMDETDPDSWNQRLEAMLWREQATLFHSAPTRRSLFEPAAWSAGFEAGKSSWAGMTEAATRDLRGVFLALRTTYFSGPPGNHTEFLTLRALPNSIHFRLRTCAHTWNYPELCTHHMAWLDGYSRALNPLVTWQHLPAQEGSTQACEMIGTIPV